VTSDTIQNWIRAGILPAQRTAGGQYRVRVEDLRRFMIGRGMCLMELDRDMGEERQPYCWECHQGQRRRQAAEPDLCENCVVKQALALRCFDLRKHMGHRGMYCESSCADCEYYRIYARHDK